MTAAETERPSLGKVYDAINEVKLDVAVIKAALPDIADHEARIRAIEKRQYTLAGLASIAGAALGAIVQRFTI
ncbi:hypothetical protein [Agromyces sp. CCNWLW203]|uniref:hypothetical protein n=1 Tax=Agromyces sp. CCNWLW203 TaxID=3112842 RepID=UPI002F969BF5